MNYADTAAAANPKTSQFPQYSVLKRSYLIYIILEVLDAFCTLIGTIDISVGAQQMDVFVRASLVAAKFAKRAANFQIQNAKIRHFPKRSVL